MYTNSTFMMTCPLSLFLMGLLCDSYVEAPEIMLQDQLLRQAAFSTMSHFVAARWILRF